MNDNRLQTAIGRRIAALRGERGWTLAELSRQMGGFDPTAIGRMERGDYGISANHLESFADAFGVYPADLLPDSPSGADRTLLDAMQSGDAPSALQALATALGTTVHALVGIPRSAPAGLDRSELAGLGRATAVLVAHIARIVADDPEEAAALAVEWLEGRRP